MGGTITPATIAHRPRGVVKTAVHVLCDASGNATAQVVGVGFGKLVGVACKPGTLDFSNAIVTIADADTGAALVTYDTLTPAALLAAGNPSTAGANSGDVFTSVAHGLHINDEIVLVSFGGSSTGLTAGVHYWVKTVGTVDTFQLSAAAPNATTGVTGSLLVQDGDTTSVLWVKVSRSRIFSGTTTGDLIGGVTANLFTASEAHGLKIGDTVQLISKTGGSGLALATSYYVIAEGFAATTFELATSKSGVAADIGSDVSASVWKVMTPQAAGVTLSSHFRPSTVIITSSGDYAAIAGDANNTDVNRDIFLGGKVSVAVAQGGNLGAGDVYLVVDESDVSKE